MKPFLIYCFLIGLIEGKRSDDPLIYDVAVLGAGLFGSATAKYVSEDVEFSVLIGPSESAKHSTDIFGAWFDEGRIAELADSTDPWYTVAKHSIGRFRSIEQESGIKLFKENGFLNILSTSSPENLEIYGKLAQTVIKDGFNLVNVTDDYAKEIFPYMSFPPGFVAYHQPDYSGVLNPRRMVRAQQKIASKKGCKVIDGHVTEVLKLFESLFQIRVRLSDNSAEIIILTRKLVISMGAYINLNSWLHKLVGPEFLGLEPDLSASRETAAFLEYDPEELEKLDKMPNIVTHYPYGQLDGTYILPPTVYPDGKVYLKIGHLESFESIIPDDNGFEDIKEWYKIGTGNPEAVQVLTDFLKLDLMPNVKVKNISSTACVIVKTPGMTNPYIGYIGEGVVLVGGGNGFGANGSDEIGRIGAKLATRNEWTSELSPETFKIHWRKSNKALQQKTNPKKKTKWNVSTKWEVFLANRQPQSSNLSLLNRDKS